LRGRAGGGRPAVPRPSGRVPALRRRGSRDPPPGQPPRALPARGGVPRALPSGRMSSGPDLSAARARIAGHVWRTPVLRSPGLDAASGRELYLKCESLQRTGSFKLRGATNAVRALPEGTPGVVAVSSGNHAQAVARAARDAGMKALIVM